MSFKNYPGRGGTVSHLSSFPQYQSLAETYGCSAVHRSFLSDYFARCSSLYHLDLLGHYGCVNAVEFSNNGGEFIVSGGDDRRVVVWNIKKCVYGTQPPVSMKGEHKSNIFCTVFDNDNRHIFSAGNDNQALRHDFTTGETVGMYYHDDPVYGLNIHPEDNNVFLTASDDGKVMLWDIRTSPVSGSSMCIAHHEAAFHAAVFNPVDPSLIATANSKKGVQLWDIRVPISCLRQFSYGAPQMCAMGLKWNKTGDMITALRRRLPPVLYHVTQSSAVAEFHHPGYNNVCTMKSNCFAGSKDQFVVSGSDDFNIYIWEVPDDWADHNEVLTIGRAFMVLHGHRSIVNQVRFNPETHMLLSAGVEKVIKVWSPFPVPRGCSKKDASHKSRRELYSHSDYLSFIQFGGLPLNHDEYESKSTAEDPRMLAFFDSLIQREKDNLHSDSEDRLLDDFHLSFILQPDSSEESDSDTTETSMSHLLLRELLHRPSPGTLEGHTATNSSGQGVLRRLRKLRDTAVIRDLLNADSSSTDSEEESRVKVVLPALPSDLKSDEDTTQSTVQFKRHKPHTKRHYRSRNRSKNVDDTSSSESANESDYSQRKIQNRTDKDSSLFETSNSSGSSNSSSSSSSNHSESDSRKSKGSKENTESSSDDAKICKFSHKRRKLHKANSSNSSNCLETQENVCKATEVNTTGSTKTHRQLDGNNSKDSQNANNILHGEGMMNSDRYGTSQTDCCSDLHVNNEKVTPHESSLTDLSNYNSCGNKKSFCDQRDDHEESSR